MKEPVIDRRIH